MPRPDTPRWERLQHLPTPPRKLAKESELLEHMGTSASLHKVAAVRVLAVVSRFGCDVIDFRLASMLKGCFHPTFMRFSPSLSPNIIGPGLSTLLSIHGHALEYFIYFTLRASGGREGRMQRMQHHCFTTDARRATQPVLGRWVSVLLPFGEARLVHVNGISAVV